MQEVLYHLILGPALNGINHLSQVVKPFPGSPGYVTLNESPLLIAAGDGFVHSNFDGCVTSAMSVVKAVKVSML
jgi:hypothetical protein